MIKNLKIKFANWLLEDSDVDKEIDTVFEYISDLETSHAKISRLERDVKSLNVVVYSVAFSTNDTPGKKPVKTVKKATKK